MKRPSHLAIIMDGNGRWAKRKNKSRHFGHIRGTQVAKSIIQECAKLKIPYLTLYAFSSENWLRPAAEVSILMKILNKYLKKETTNLVKENIRFNTIGDSSQLSEEIRSIVNDAKNRTAHCTGMTLTFALSYGGRQELTHAIQAIAEKIKSGDLKSDMINEDLVRGYLPSNHLPDPDLILRTSGEKRLSNFLLWQSAYSELYFSEKLWPDFTEADLQEALIHYSSRERRYGRISDLPSTQLT